MTVRRRRAPRYARATRRLALVHVGLPTLLACVIAVGPPAAAQASGVPPKAAALVTTVTTAARGMLDPPPGDHADHGGRGADRHAVSGRPG